MAQNKPQFPEGKAGTKCVNCKVAYDDATPLCRICGCDNKGATLFNFSPAWEQQRREELNRAGLI